MIRQYLDELVALPSHSGEETAVADYLIQKTRAIKSHRLLVDEYRGQGRSVLLLPENPVILLDAHLDTVPPGDLTAWNSPPLQLQEIEGNYQGLGTLDDKCNLALCLELLSCVDCHQVGFVFPGSEEVDALGLKNLLQKKLIPKAQLAIALEATGLNVFTAHKGAAHVELHFSGVSAHSSRPELGVNAIEKASTFIEFFQKDKTGLIKSHLELGPTTSAVTRIQGGDVQNKIPASCQVDIDVRLVPSQTCDGLKTWFNEYLTAHELEAQVHVDYVPPLSYLGSPEWITRLQQSGAGEQNSAPFWTHAALYAEAGIPSLVFGPGNISTAHAPNESVEIKQIDRAFAILKKLIENL